ncbi:MAG: nitrilase-related carbon-nitrogen hydrolase [Parvibaculaceae bacterium]
MTKKLFSGTLSAPLSGQWLFLWLAIGATSALLSVGGRWDLPIAAWASAIFLLRFSRITRPSVGLPLIWLVSGGATLFWVWQLAVPTSATTLLAALVYGTIFTLPYVADRFVASKLSPALALSLFPAAQATCEFIMGSFSPLGTAYGLSAFTQHDNLALLQVTSLVGPYSIGFLIGLCATVVNDIWQQQFSHSRMRTIGATYAALLIVLIAGGEMRLAFFPATSAAVRIAGISPSMSAEDAAQQVLGGNSISDQAISKLDPEAKRLSFAIAVDEMFASTHKAAQTGAKIVVWSENAVRTLSADKPALLERAKLSAKQENIYLLLAVKTYLPDAPYGRDQTQMIDPQGNVLWTYDKAHPIPGLETYTPGDGHVPVIDTPYGRIASVICYDADFPSTTRAGTDIMLVPGGDWPEMGRVHTEMASLRAIENGYALFRQDFNGMSAAYDHHGQLIASQDTTGAGPHIFVTDVPNRGVTTLTRLTGDAFAWICLFGVLALIGFGLRRPRTNTL